MLGRSLITLRKPSTQTLEVKKSTFIATAVRVDSVEEARRQLERLSDPEASHNCWAYRVNDEYRFSDDGEPGGTAGRPIFTAIEGQGLDHLLVVVTRYFGGIKLGAGGLVRAYGKAAGDCLSTALKDEVKPTVRLSIQVPFPLANSLHSTLDEFGLQAIDERFTSEGPCLTVELEIEMSEALISRIRDVTFGRARVDSLSREPSN